jgi:23S rRNA (cytidine1920-2'-O)/16S rRNA (cytidine1409-2'-O)-methyltransferase
LTAAKKHSDFYFSSANGKKGKRRLDVLLLERNLVKSRERAKAVIMAGQVLVDDLMVDKAGTVVATTAKIILRGEDIPFVSRGGLKLNHAIKKLNLSVKDFICLDIGASTGGFTDCLLKSGAAFVHAVDVGYGQLDWSLRQDPRVDVIERTNVRYMDFERIGHTVDLVTVDTSFISLKIVVPAAEKFMHNGTRVLALIKPQFEAGKSRIGKGGVVRDPEIRKEIVQEIREFFIIRGYATGEVIPSPVPGPKGNQEFIISLRYSEDICNKV